MAIQRYKPSHPQHMDACFAEATITHWICGSTSPSFPPHCSPILSGYLKKLTLAVSSSLATSTWGQKTSKSGSLPSKSTQGDSLEVRGGKLLSHRHTGKQRAESKAANSLTHSAWCCSVCPERRSLLKLQLSLCQSASRSGTFHNHPQTTEGSLDSLASQPWLERVT